jgi:thiamine biosynthesis lipoprotein
MISVFNPVRSDLFMKNHIIVLLYLSIILISCNKRESDFYKITGFTQGTTYNIIFDGKTGISTERAGAEVDTILLSVDNSLSVYNSASVISQLNRNETDITDTLFREVFRKSEAVSVLTGGSFDITVMPLVKSWGFGPDEIKNISTEKIDSLLSLVGYNKVRLSGRKLVKSDPRITIDVNAIAQGYTVDLICSRFDELGIENYLVEVGGEVRVKGKKGSRYWNVGIDKPSEENMLPGGELKAIVRLYNKSLATSGNYRKFYIENGVKYSHTIDPSTGYPAKNRLLSATIVAEECAIADAIATACMVKGQEWSIDFILKHEEIEGYLVFSGNNGEYETWISAGLLKFLTEQN